jgi:hypothetical protein
VFENVKTCAEYLKLNRTILSSYFSGKRHLPTRIENLYEVYQN